MQVATTTPAPDFATLRAVSGVHDANFDALKLARLRTIYAARYQRLQDLLLLDDEGHEVTITLSSPSRTLTLTQREADACFNLAEIYGVLGNSLDALKDEILDMLAGKGRTVGMEGTDNALICEAHTLCLPAGSAPLLPVNTTSAAAKAA